MSTFIESFKDFYIKHKKETKRYINEIGNQPLEITWNKQNDIINGEFYIEDQPFNIEFTPLDGNTTIIYQFKFYRDGETSLFNDVKYSFKVLSTLKQALSDVMDWLHPDILVFAAVDDSSARKSLYKTMGGYLATKYNYHDITRNQDLIKMGLLGNNIFGIYKNKEILQKDIKQTGL